MSTNVGGIARPAHPVPEASRRSGCGPLVGGLFCSDAARDWDWEGIRVGGRLHLYCYLRDAVVALAPFELEAAPRRTIPK